MKQTEMRQVGERLGELAEYYERKPPSAKALVVWGDALAQCALGDVLAALSDWPKTKRAFPIASEVVESCRNRASERIDASAKCVAPEPFRLAPDGNDPSSPAYLAFKAWWRDFVVQPPACEHPDNVGVLVRIGAVFTSQHAPHRPGDFEAKEERAAIQAEGNGQWDAGTQ